jgi:thiosulfate/3-mercaptopyruvate sulfurtransferase
MSAFLIEADELRRDIEQGDVPLIIDARKPPEYAAGHIAGAVNFSTYDIFALDTRPDGLAAFARDMGARYLRIGLSNLRPVVVYEEDTGMRAARDAWILQLLGHQHVGILHGGLAAWRAAGCALSAEPAEEWTVAFRVRERPGLVIGCDEIAARLGAPDMTLLDVRDPDEHAGRDKTACCPRRGRIPGSVRIEWTDFLEDGRFKRPEAIRGLLEERGLDLDSEFVPYCHRGARSANTYYALRHAGIPRTRNYIGSWHEWSSRADLPLEKG